jgi:hypothetical protein
MSTELQNEPEVEVIDAPEPQEVEIPVDDAPVEQPVTQEPKEEKTFNPKTDKVQFDTPEQQERFNEVFRMMKKSDQRNEMLTDFLQEQQRQLDELRGVTTEFKQEKIQTDQAEAERAIMARIRQARDEQNDEAYDKAFMELTEFKAGKLFDAKVNELSKKETVQAGNDAKFVAKAMEEKDESGNYIRPWLQESDPQFGVALYQIKKISSKYEGDPDILAKTLKELDQTMGSQMKKTEPPKDPPAQTRAPNPMGGTNLTNHKPKGTIKMSREEFDIKTKLEKYSGKKLDPARWVKHRDAMQKAGR